MADVQCQNLTSDFGHLTLDVELWTKKDERRMTGKVFLIIRPSPVACINFSGRLLLAGRGCALRLLRALPAGRLARVALADAGGFAAQFAQVIELGPTDAPALHHVNAINDRRVQREDALDADAETRLAHRDRLAHAAAFARDHDALKNLYAPLVLGFLDAQVSAHRVARLKVRDRPPYLCLFNCI